MKPTSKKDEFVIKLDSNSQTQMVKDFYCPNNGKIWIKFEYAVLRNDLGKGSMLYHSLPDFFIKMPIISFEEWRNLPDETNDVYSNSEFNNESKVIGYKLIKEEYREVACKIAFSGREGHFFNLNRGIKNDSVVHYKLKEAGVMHWFEPVFEEKKIKLTSGIELTEKDIEEVKEILKNK